MHNNQPPVYNQYNQPMNQYNQQQPQAGFAYANTNANQPQFQNNQYAPINQGPVNAAAPVAKQRRQKPVFKLPVDEDYEDAEEDEEKEEVTKTKPVAPKKASPPKVENKNKSKNIYNLIMFLKSPQNSSKFEYF